MNDQTEIAPRESTQIQKNRESAYTLRPAVNVFEDAEGITLEADMPGVPRDRLQLQADKDSLLIEGELQIAMPEGIDALYADIRETRYSRSFALSRELDAQNIDASLKDGVLRLRIPKREEVRPRKIEVRAD
ncbi:Hsp20/alpha crystallin family protein [Thiocystis violascens]|uniref:Molecular chaperone (Small heat shock protein) n=1 Tax=Thiocystis violascens (strain ATCC 17096 / DSM 198 / 6111) TaxID=765911 RepID=I3Y6V0_THIV6|nr:Hsp20/alpha crystallin family protein [Thiocystis violascens]AFL72718.1 molecular chaperone (small heat shock protein) [Thiocystis violascens DSM 198]